MKGVILRARDALRCWSVKRAIQPVLSSRAGLDAYAVAFKAGSSGPLPDGAVCAVECVPCGKPLDPGAAAVTVNIREAKPQLSRLIEPVIIAKAGKPVESGNQVSWT